MKQFLKESLGVEKTNELKAALTFQDERNKQDIEKGKKVRGRPIPVQTYSAYAENETHLRVPKYFEFAGEAHGAVFQPSLYPGSPAHFQMHGDDPLRPVQAEALGLLLERLEKATPLKPQGATLCLPCGFGKTRTAIVAVQRLAVKTLVLASHSHLLIQFSKEAQRITTGLVVSKLPKSPLVPLDPEAQIIFGTLQSVYCRNYPPRYWSTIGLVIVDEAHHLAAPTFCQAMCKLPVCRTLALTATPERKDGREALIYYLAGDTAFRAYRPKNSMVTVKFVHYAAAAMPKGCAKNYENVGERMLLLGKLSRLEERNAVIVEKIKKLRTERCGILVLCKLINHLHHLAELCDLDPGCYGFFTGQEKQAQREEASQKRIIFATFDMAKEGLDIPRLDTLILGSPAENTIQCLGRILRDVPNKLDPLVVDVYDDCVAFRGEIWSRIRLYTETGARIVGIKE